MLPVHWPEYRVPPPQKGNATNLLGKEEQRINIIFHFFQVRAKIIHIKNYLIIFVNVNINTSKFPQISSSGLVVSFLPYFQSQVYRDKWLRKVYISSNCREHSSQTLGVSDQQLLWGAQHRVPWGGNSFKPLPGFQHQIN